MDAYLQKGWRWGFWLELIRDASSRKSTKPFLSSSFELHFDFLCSLSVGYPRTALQHLHHPCRGRRLAKLQWEWEWHKSWTVNNVRNERWDSYNGRSKENVQNRRKFCCPISTRYRPLPAAWGFMTNQQNSINNLSTNGIIFQLHLSGKVKGTSISNRI